LRNEVVSDQPASAHDHRDAKDDQHPETQREPQRAAREAVRRCGESETIAADAVTKAAPS